MLMLPDTFTLPSYKELIQTYQMANGEICLQHRHKVFGSLSQQVVSCQLQVGDVHGPCSPTEKSENSNPALELTTETSEVQNPSVKDNR